MDLIVFVRGACSGAGEAQISGRCMRPWSASPAVKAVVPGILATSDGKTDKPQDQKNQGKDPEKMGRETETEENQDKQKCQK